MEKNTWKSIRLSEPDKVRLEEVRERFAEEHGMDMSFDAFLRFLIFQGLRIAEKQLENEAYAVTDAA